MNAFIKEPFSPDFRYETVVRTIKELADGQLVIKFDPNIWPDQTNTTIKTNLKLLGDATALYANPRSSQVELEEFEPKVFAAILFLKAADILKPAINRDKLETDLSAIRLTQIALNDVLKEILIVLTEVKERVERLG